MGLISLATTLEPKALETRRGRAITRALREEVEDFMTVKWLGEM
jgi:hypothetical protein